MATELDERRAESALDGVRFGRSRALAILGGGLVGLSTRLFVPAEARASHVGPPPPCFGFPKCHCCSDRATCCLNSCYWHTWHDHGCPTNLQCWVSCRQGALYRCCDWHSGNGLCLCRSYWGNC
jgi:hypothetical protein